MDLDAVADELYALWPAEFTAARTAREKEARAEGDKALAAQIKAGVSWQSEGGTTFALDLPGVPASAATP